MKPSAIQVGKTYCNRGKGTTRRRVINIGKDCKPFNFYSNNDPPDEPGVHYAQIDSMGKTHHDTLYLSSFAAWAGREVE